MQAPIDVFIIPMQNDRDNNVYFLTTENSLYMLGPNALKKAYYTRIFLHCVAIFD